MNRTDISSDRNCSLFVGLRLASFYGLVLKWLVVVILFNDAFYLRVNVIDLL